MKDMDIEKLIRDAGILYWKENEVYQENAIGIQDNIKKSENIDNPLLIQYSRGD